LDLTALADCQAIALFVQQARMGQSDFRLTPENASDVVQICRHLEGLPLAIELAAARVKLLSPWALLARLDKRLDALTGGSRDLPPHHQTLRRTIDWSYHLLDDDEKMLFARLSAFCGGRSAEAIETICGPGLPGDPLEGVESLLNKNLIYQQAGADGEPRFILLETIHEYASERLVESGEMDTLRRRHAEYFMVWIERINFELRGGPTQHQWFKRLRVESDNVRIALEWSLGGADVELGLRLVGAIWPFWFRQDHASLRRWATQALEQMKNASPTTRAGALMAIGYMMGVNHDWAAGRQHMKQALSIYRQLEDRSSIEWTLIHLAGASTGATDTYTEAIAQCEEGLALAVSMDDKAGLSQAFNVIGELTRMQGDYYRARAAYEEALAVGRATGDRLRVQRVLIGLACIAEHDEDFQQAVIFLREALAQSRKDGNNATVVDSLAILAGVIGRIGHREQAATLIGATEMLLESLGLALQPGVQPIFQRDCAYVRGQLGAGIFERCRNEGRAMSLEQAVAYALATPTGHD
jgi:tetratricopeptide (TPR) repeat protein